jgi:transposase
MTVQERRRRVVNLVKAGWSEREIAKKLGVSRSTIWSDKQVAGGAK